MDDLWPADIKGKSKLKAPVAILREQGSLLGEKTNNIVIGEVKRVTKMLAPPGRFEFSFLIKAPALGYTYEFFSISYEITLYPVLFLIADYDILEDLSIDPEGPPARANDENEFKDFLKEIFNTEKSKLIISAILAQTEESTI